MLASTPRPKSVFTLPGGHSISPNHTGGCTRSPEVPNTSHSPTLASGHTRKSFCDNPNGFPASLDQPYNPPWKPEVYRKPEVCRNFLENRCFRGRRCYRFHPTPDEKNSLVSRPQKTEPYRNSPEDHRDYDNRRRPDHLRLKIRPSTRPGPASSVRTNEAPVDRANNKKPTPGIERSLPIMDARLNSVLTLDCDHFLQFLQDVFGCPGPLNVKLPKGPIRVPKKNQASRKKPSLSPNAHELDISTAPSSLPASEPLQGSDINYVNLPRTRPPPTTNRVTFRRQAEEQWDPGIHSRRKTGGSESTTSFGSRSDLFSSPLTTSTPPSTCQASEIAVDNHKKDTVIDSRTRYHHQPRKISATFKHANLETIKDTGRDGKPTHRVAARAHSLHGPPSNGEPRATTCKGQEEQKRNLGRPNTDIQSSTQGVELSSNLTVNVLTHSKAKFGPGFEVLDVTTGFESPWIFISNIPEVSHDAVYAVLKPFGHIMALKFAEWNDSSSMTVKARFASHSEAAQVVTTLNGSQLFGRKIEVRLAIGDARNINGSLKDTCVLVEWEAPGRVAYAGYATLPEAEAGIALARSSRDRCINANIYQGLPAIGAYNVRFRRVPPNADIKDVECFGQPETVMLENPNYLSLPGAIRGIRSILERLGQPTFEMVPPPYSDGMVHAWATFSTPQQAKAASEHLHGLRPAFIGKGYIWAYHMKTVSYKLSHDAFSSIEADVHHLRDSCFKRFGDGTFLRISRKSPPHSNLPVHIITLSGENLKHLGCLKLEFERILQGEIVRQDGKAAWDLFFSQPAGKEYLGDLERGHTPVTIRTDENRRMIILVGPSKIREVVRDTLLKKITALHRQKVHTIPVTGKTIGLFFSADLIRLQRHLGVENVSLDLGRRILSVRGNDAAFESAQKAIRRIEENEPTKRGREISECPVCFNQVVSPVTLECGHVWCKACLSGYILAAVDNKLFPLTCLGNEASCPHLISIATAHEILPASDFDAVVHASFLAYVHSRPDEFYYCPTPDCRQIYRSGPENTILQCPECLIRICPKCRIEYHDGIECAERVGSSDQQFKEWSRKHDVKNCPGCRAPIERTEGCNHVTCTRCQTHTCWVCMETFPGGEGIYGHMRRLHGGIGL